jgi:transcriptional regulator with XRE-family HTH domain
LAAPGKQFKSSELRLLIARRLKAARMAYDEQAAPVARALGVSKQAISGYESGRTYPDELFLVRFNALTGCPLDWIFLGKITAEMPATMAARIAAFDPELLRLGPAAQARVAERNEKAGKTDKP